MLKFYDIQEKMQTLSAHLSWSHYCELLPIQSIYEIKYYIKMSEMYNLSVRELRKRIKSKEYERLDESTKQKLIDKEEYKVTFQFSLFNVLVFF